MSTTTTATARRLWNDDVLREIFYCLEPASLACCARSNTALFEPAIDLLWQEVNSLTDVLNVLSPAFRKVVDADDGPTIYVLAGGIPEEAFARLQYYAARVRRLEHSTRDHRIERPVIEALRDRLKGKALFPSLQYLSWTQRNDNDMWDILEIPLVGRTFRDLSIDGVGAQANIVPRLTRSRARTLSSVREFWGNFIRTMSSRCPWLQVLTLSGNIHSSHIASLGTVKRLRILRIVNSAHNGFGSGYLSALRICAALSLEELGINLADEESIDNIGFTGFHALRALRIHGPLSLTTRFLSHVSSPSLARFSLFVPRPDRWEDYHLCLAALCVSSSSTLHTVRLSGSWTGNMASLARPLDVLAPLLSLPQLEEVCFFSMTGLALPLSTDDVHAVATAWPRLRELQLMYQPVPAALPITALAAFARHCPRLETLWLVSVDLRGVGERPIDPCACAGAATATSASSHALRNIWLAGDVPLANVGIIAQRIDEMFPCADVTRDAHPWHPCQDVLGWEKILASLEERQKARLQRTLSQITEAL